MTKVPEDLNALYETVCTSENPDAVTLIELIERIARLEAQNKALCEALGKIARWEMPRNVYIDGVEMEYGIAYGSQGEKHVIRSIARAAIAQAKEQG